MGRFGDYISGKFSASTNFKVGEAVKYLRDNVYRVVIRFDEVDNRKVEEKRILQNLRGTFRLLNDLKGYDYNKSNERDERQNIQQFVDQILENPYRMEPKMSTKGSTDLPIPEQIKQICKKLVFNGEAITRQNILREAKKLDINERSVQPADYCNNKKTGDWSKHSFLHWEEKGKYTLIQ